MDITACKIERITRRDGDPYLWRFIVFRCRWFGVYLHRFLDSDDECLHDHPWPFVSVILRGGYWETLGEQWTDTVAGPRFVQLPKRWHRPGSILFRRAATAHRIEIEPWRSTWSLVVIGPRWRGWGFFTRFGWIPWRKYSHAKHC